MTCKDCGKDLGARHGKTERCSDCKRLRRIKNQGELRKGLRKAKPRHEQGTPTRWELRYQMFLQWWERPQYGPNETKTSPTREA